MGILFAVIPIIGGLIMYAIIHAIVRAGGNLLQRKFINLGTLQGKTYNEIVAVVGSPNSVSSSADGGKICQWLQTGYHISLLFDNNDICLGVNHETKV